MSVTRFRSVATVLLCLHLGGCTTWQPVLVSPREFIEAERPFKIRLRDEHGDWMQVSYPRVEGDTVSGTTAGARPRGGPRTAIPIRMAVTDLPVIEAKRVNTPQTVIAVAGVTSVLLGAVLCVTGVACSK